jgi:hypothetical protein
MIKDVFMLGLITSIILFNFIAFKTNTRLSKNQILQIWLFTIAFQTIFDTYVDLEYKGYWYFTRHADWQSLLNLILLIPPVNMMFLNWYPFTLSLIRQILYFIGWEVVLLTYEMLALLPEPYGYFHYGWWNLGHSAVINPLLLLSLLHFYKFVLKLEREG